MTNEEAIAYAKRAVNLGLNDETQAFCDMAIKALEQQPCEDCISRQAVEEMIKAEMPERGMWEIEGDKEKETVCEVCVDLMQKLSELPSVTPKAESEDEYKKGYSDGFRDCLDKNVFCIESEEEE